MNQTVISLDSSSLKDKLSKILYRAFCDGVDVNKLENDVKTLSLMKLIPRPPGYSDCRVGADGVLHFNFVSTVFPKSKPITSQGWSKFNFNIFSIHLNTILKVFFNRVLPPTLISAGYNSFEKKYWPSIDSVAPPKVLPLLADRPLISYFFII